MNWARKIGRREMVARLAKGLGAAAAASLLVRWSFRRSYRRLQERIEQFQADRKSVAPLPGLLDLKGVIHVHSLLSHDSKGTPEEIVRSAHEAGLRFLITTDHNNKRIFTEGIQGRFDDLWVIRGAEFVKKGQALLAIDIQDYIDGRGMAVRQVVREIKSQGGLAFVAHPLGFRDWDIEGIDGMEIYNISDSARAQAWKAPWLVLELLSSWDDYPGEAFLSLLSRPGHHLSQWDKALQTKRLVGIAGNNAHKNLKVFGRQLDPYPLTFKYVQTHLLAAALEKRALLDALKAGHAYLSFGLLADATGFQFFARRDGLVGIMGDEMPYSPGLVLTVQTPQSTVIQLFRNGQVVEEAASTRLDHLVKEKGTYRVEAFLEIRGDRYPWIFSNPIYVV